jgi:hypothetical protein
MDWLFEAFKIHGPWAAVVALAILMGRKHVEEDAAAHQRITDLEQKTVSKKDFQRLEDRFEDHASEMREGQTEILKLLASRGDHR